MQAAVADAAERVLVTKTISHRNIRVHAKFFGQEWYNQEGDVYYDGILKKYGAFTIKGKRKEGWCCVFRGSIKEFWVAEIETIQKALDLYAEKQRNILQKHTYKNTKWQCYHCGRKEITRKTYVKHMLKFWNVEKAEWTQSRLPAKPADKDLPHLEIIPDQQRAAKSISDAHVNDIKERRKYALLSIANEEKKRSVVPEAPCQRMPFDDDEATFARMMTDSECSSGDEDKHHDQKNAARAGFNACTLSRSAAFQKHVRKRRARDVFVDVDNVPNVQIEEHVEEKQEAPSHTNAQPSSLRLAMLKKWQLSSHVSAQSFSLLLEILSLFEFFGEPEGVNMTNYKLNKTLKVCHEDFDDFHKYACCNNCSFPHPYVSQKERNTWPNDAPPKCNRPLPMMNNKEQICQGTYYELKKGGWRPILPFTHVRLKEDIAALFQRPEFRNNIEHWRSRQKAEGVWLDVYDGRVWKKMQESNFFSVGSLAFMYSVDWFQPWQRGQYSAGAAWLVCLNLPREIRFKKENQILVSNFSFF